MAASSAPPGAAVPSRARPPLVPPALALLSWLSLALLAGCESSPVTWLDDAPVATAHPSPLTAGAAVALDSTLADTSALATFLLEQDRLREAGAATLVAAPLDSMADAARQVAAAPMMGPIPGRPEGATMGAGTFPDDPARCARSLRLASSPARGTVAAWWSRRSGGRVALVAAWRDRVEGDSAGTAPWRGPIVIDSLDQGPPDPASVSRGVSGCVRPAPGVAIDDRHGFVHVVYALRGPEGAGVFYAHQMDPRAAFEPPQAIVYGDRLGPVRVAAAGDVVAIAYEDPNAVTRSRVALAVSRTAGHTFEERLVASSDVADARDPHVAVRGAAIVLGWSELPATAGDTVFRLRRATVR